MKKVLYIIVNILYLVLVYALPKYFDIPFIPTAIVLVILYFVSFYIIDKSDNFGGEKELERKIMKIMKEEGYNCEKNDGVLCYRMNDVWFRVYFGKRWNKCYRTDIIYYGKVHKDWGSISIEGKSVLDNYINRKFEHIKFISNNSGVACEHITSINNAKEFLEEAKNAYRLIDEAIDAVVDILPKIKLHYSCSEQKNAIGFNTNKNDENS